MNLKALRYVSKSLKHCVHGFVYSRNVDIKVNIHNNLVTLFYDTFYGVSL